MGLEASWVTSKQKVCQVWSLGLVGVGALFAGSGYLIKEGQNTNGHGLASITSLALIGGMAPRALKGGMAAGVVALGVGSLVYNAKKTLDWMDSE